MQAKVLDAGLVLGKTPVVMGLHYDLEKLIITYDPDIPDKRLEIIFGSPRGFRCLDESDLINFWEHKIMVQNWLFEIVEGGWLDHEARREGFISKDFGYKEFLICGADDCVSVISNDPPLFRVISIP